MNRRSGAGRVDEDVKALDEAAFNVDHVRSGHCDRTLWRSRTPAQAGESVVAHGRSDGLKTKVGGRLASNAVDRMRDRVVARCNVIGFVKDRVGCIELANRRMAFRGITLTKDTFEVRLQKAIEINCACIHRSPSKLYERGKPFVLCSPQGRDYRVAIFERPCPILRSAVRSCCECG